VSFGVSLESVCPLGIFPVGRIFSNQGSTLLVGELKGDLCARLHRTSVFVSHHDFRPDRDIFALTEQRQLNPQRPPQYVEPCPCVESLGDGIRLI